MTQMNNFCDERMRSILQSNNYIKRSTSNIIQVYLEIQKSFFEKVSTVFNQLDTVKSVGDIFLNDDQKQLLNEFKPSEKVQLAICGYNSAGKTTFVHELLGCGNFLPTGIGATSARIVQFTYVPPNEACIIQHKSEFDPDTIEEETDLSFYFDDTVQKKNTKLFKETIKKYVARPTIDPMSDDFTRWASHLIEIRIPSLFLQLGIDIYDTPGFLGSDSPVLAKNLQKLVSSRRPAIIYLYENPVVSDDAKKSFDQLKLALHHHFHDVAIFFLNTKADVSTIRNDAKNENEDEYEDMDDDMLLNRARLIRYNLLLKSNEISTSISDGKSPPLEQCDCFDIFSSLSSNDTMDNKMKTHAINNIIRFAAERDLRDTKQIINVILSTIDDFFDFVLITNRRSVGEWKKLLDNALQWTDEYFARYHKNITNIVDEAKRHLPLKLNEKCQEIVQRALPHCKTTWWEQIITPGISNDSNSSISPAAFEYVDMTIKKEIMQPILDQITSKISQIEKQKLNQTKATASTIKNELLMTAYREVMMISGDYGSFYSRHTRTRTLRVGMVFAMPFLLIHGAVRHGLGKHINRIRSKPNTEFNDTTKTVEQKHMEDIVQYISDLQENIAQATDEITKGMENWLENSRNQFIRKVKDYYQFVVQTLHQREAAYTLAHKFAPIFARIECCLVANLDLAKHDGIPLTVQDDVTLVKGDFFSIHPAAWGAEPNFVAKKLIDPINNENINYIGAHFHRTVTRLGIPNMVPLSYLYEISQNPQQFAIVLPRYPTNLHSYLSEHIQKITIDKSAQIVLDIARAIAHMHTYELVHRDIKVQNILLDENDRPFLADFGACQHGTQNATFIGLKTLAPELTTSDHQYSYQGSAYDVFCLGVLMYVLAPKPTFHQPRTLTEADVNSLDRNQIPESYCHLILRCIDRDPEKRPTANEVVQELENFTGHVVVIKFEECLFDDENQ